MSFKLFVLLFQNQVSGRYELVGISSFGDGCPAETDKPSQYHNIKFYHLISLLLVLLFLLLFSYFKFYLLKVCLPECPNSWLGLIARYLVEPALHSPVLKRSTVVSKVIR